MLVPKFFSCLVPPTRGPDWFPREFDSESICGSLPGRLAEVVCDKLSAGRLSEVVCDKVSSGRLAEVV